MNWTDSPRCFASRRSMMGHDAGFPFDVLYHRVGGAGADSFWTFTVGVFYW
jgi:hypothetical protein